MVQLSTSVLFTPPTVAPVALAPASAAPADAAAFSLDLADPAALPGVAVDPVSPDPAVGRHSFAATGNPLPPTLDPDGAIHFAGNGLPLPPQPVDDEARFAKLRDVYPAERADPPAASSQGPSIQAASTKIKPIAILSGDAGPIVALPAVPAASTTIEPVADDEKKQDDNGEAPLELDPAATIVPIAVPVPPPLPVVSAGSAEPARTLPDRPIVATSPDLGGPATIPADTPSEPSGPASGANPVTAAAAERATGVAGNPPTDPVEILAGGKATPVNPARPLPDAASTIAARPTPTVRPDIAPPLIGVPQPAVRAFAAGIAAAGRQRHEPRQADPTLAGVGLAAVDRPAQTALIGIDATPLDTRSDQWPRQLIERIEALRDAADAKDTRIRLVPAALGKIDVALRQQGDTLYVQFSADVPATRVLLSEAQPRLAEIAQERGLRLGQSGVDGGQAQQDRRAHQPDAPVPRRPAPAAMTAVDIMAEQAADQRIA